MPDLRRCCSTSAACSSSPTTSASSAPSPAPSTRSRGDARRRALPRRGAVRDRRSTPRPTGPAVGGSTSRATSTFCGCPTDLRERGAPPSRPRVRRRRALVPRGARVPRRPRALAATGVRLGIVSNADGMIGERLRDARDPAGRAPAWASRSKCVIDSGAVGVLKPDPRIFRLALDAMDVDAAVRLVRGRHARRSTWWAPGGPGCVRSSSIRWACTTMPGTTGSRRWASWPP